MVQQWAGKIGLEDECSPLVILVYFAGDQVFDLFELV